MKERSMEKVFIAAFLIISLMVSVASADQLKIMMDGFYDGLGKIIERNMDNPDLCVAEVEDYYVRNRALIDTIRKQTEEAIAESMAMMGPYYDEFEGMTEEELALLKERSEAMAGREPRMSYQAMSAGMKRYNEALEAFMVKHPNQAMIIATKALEFLPQLDRRR